MLSTELSYLVASIVLGFVYIAIAGAAVTIQRGPDWNMGARDGQAPPLTGLAGRLDRALSNFKETFPFFAAAVLIVEFTHRAGLLSVIGVMLYFWARVVYIPLYAFGVKYVRTLVWLVSVIGIFCVLASLFVNLAA